VTDRPRARNWCFVRSGVSLNRFARSCNWRSTHAGITASRCPRGPSSSWPISASSPSSSAWRPARADERAVGVPLPRLPRSVVEFVESFRPVLLITLRGYEGAHRFEDSIQRSVRSRCTATCRVGERHFRRAVTEFVEHYHLERDHQGLDNRLNAGTPASDVPGRVRRRSRLGVLNDYERAA
jgi:hypothetical protein